MAGQHFRHQEVSRTEPRTRPTGNTLPPLCETDGCGTEVVRPRIRGWVYVEVPMGEHPLNVGVWFCSGRCASIAIARHDLKATA